MCFIYDMFVHEFFFLMFCVLDIIGEIVNVEPSKYLIADKKSLTKLELTIHDTM